MPGVYWLLVTQLPLFEHPCLRDVSWSTILLVSEGLRARIVFATGLGLESFSLLLPQAILLANEVAALLGTALGQLVVPFSLFPGFPLLSA